jgi:hypothetical protein
MGARDEDMKRENILFTLEQLNTMLNSYNKLIDGDGGYITEPRHDIWVWEYKSQQTKEAINDLNNLLNETT